MNKLILMISLLICNSAFAKNVYVILEETGKGKGSREWFIGHEQPVGPSDPESAARINAKNDLSTKLKKRCLENYKGTLANVICITDLTIEENDTEGDGIVSVGGMFFFATANGKMYCRTDEENLSYWDDTWFGNSTGGANFKDCQERMTTP